MGRRIAPLLILPACLLAGLAGCDDEETNEPSREVYWEEQAQIAAKKSAGFEFECDALSAETLSRGDAVMVKWYTIGVVGCGKKASYDVTCGGGDCSAERKGEISESGESAEAETPAEAEAEGEASAEGEAAADAEASAEGESSAEGE